MVARRGLMPRLENLLNEFEERGGSCERLLDVLCDGGGQVAFLEREGIEGDDGVERCAQDCREKGEGRGVAGAVRRGMIERRKRRQHGSRGSAQRRPSWRRRKSA